MSLNPLAWFVNREKQYLGFQKMLAGETSRRIMVIQAPADMGKTWLIQRMRAHCQENDNPVMHVSFADRRAYDYLSLVRLGRDQMGQEQFNSLTQTINSLTQTNITLSTGAGAGGVNISQIESSNVSVGGDVAGGDVIKDNQFFIQTDSDVSRRAAEIKINDAFFTCLQGLLPASPIVFLFDAFENVTEEADQWLREHLLPRMADGLLEPARLIIAGREAPALPESVRPLVAATGLELFTEEHVREYILEKRMLDDLDLPTLFRTSGGYPGLLAKMADVAAMEGAEEDDEWL